MQKCKAITWVVCVDGAEHRFRFDFADGACEERFKLNVAVALSETVHQQQFTELAGV